MKSLLCTLYSDAEHTIRLHFMLKRYSPAAIFPIPALQCTLLQCNIDVTRDNVVYSASHRHCTAKWNGLHNGARAECDVSCTTWDKSICHQKPRWPSKSSILREKARLRRKSYRTLRKVGIHVIYDDFRSRQ